MLALGGRSPKSRSIRRPFAVIAPQARQKEATASRRLTQAFSLQAPHTCRSSSENQASMSTFETFGSMGPRQRRAAAPFRNGPSGLFAGTAGPVRTPGKKPAQKRSEIYAIIV